MGNNQTTWLQDRFKECAERAERRLKEYWDSKETLLSELTYSSNLKDYLRPGDILARKLSVTETSKSGSHAPSTKGGLMVHYAIYVEYQGNDQHRLIEKSDDGSIINYSTVHSHTLIQWRLVVDSRYRDTLDVALWVKKSGIDAGYSFSHANCEHFVTFCLTRWTVTSRSRQVSLPAALRDTAALFSCTVGNVAKILTHPFYLIGGDMDLSERMVKTNVPFGMDGEDIASGRKIMIGFAVRDMWHYWLEIDKDPSGHTLHQMGTKYASDDKRVIRFHR